MALKLIPLDKCYTPDVRVTAEYDEEHLKLLRDSLAAMGTINPIITIAHDGRYEVIDGLHRVDEARTRGEKTISAVVYEGSEADGLIMNLVLNKVRGKTKASQMVAVIGVLTQKHGLDSDAIALKTGLTRDYIEKLQRISTAAPSVQEALDREVIGVGVAYELSRLPSHIQQDEIVAKQQIWRFQVKELKELVDQVLEEMQKLKSAPPGAPPKVNAPPPVYKCEVCAHEADPKYLRAVLLCPDCFGEVYRSTHKPSAAEGKNEQSTVPR